MTRIQQVTGGVAVFNATLPTLNDEDPSALRVDNKQRLVVTGEAASPIPVSAAAALLISTPHASAARTATGQTTGIDYTIYKELIVELSVSAASGTVPALDVKVQVSDDNTNWFDEGTAFAQITAASTPAVKKLTNFGSWVRFVYTITGTTPSFTFSIKTQAKT